MTVTGDCHLGDEPSFIVNEYISRKRNMSLSLLADIVVNLLKKASPGAAIFRRDMLCDIPFVADWKQIGDYRQSQTDHSNTRENNK